MRSRILALGLVAAALTSSLPAAAQPAANARQYLERKQDAVMRVLRQPASPPRNARLEELLGDLLDYDELSRRALAAHWEGRTAEEQQQFVDLLRRLVERSYRQNLERTLDYQIRYEEAQAESDGVLVRTVARSRKNRRAPAVSIDYRLHRANDNWRVYDVVTDGVSMVRNYRDQFHAIIEKEGWSGLITRMRSKLEES